MMLLRRGLLKCVLKQTNTFILVISPNNTYDQPYDKPKIMNEYYYNLQFANLHGNNHQF